MFVKLSDFLDEEAIPGIEAIVETGPFTSIMVNDSQLLDVIWEQLKDKGMAGVNVWRKEDLPESYHYKEHPYVPELTLITDGMVTSM